VDRTQRNLWSAFLGEAKANRLYVAYAMKALADLEQKTGRTAPPLERPTPAAPTPAQPPPRAELDTEKGRIAALTRIREVVFGMQDGLLTTATLGAAIAGATESSRTVIIAGLASALGGMMSMSAGAFLGSRAER
jgi:VIT1/CCC1 family predicted Fe2+/Mn2+ transporter